MTMIRHWTFLSVGLILLVQDSAGFTGTVATRQGIRSSTATELFGIRQFLKNRIFRRTTNDSTPTETIQSALIKRRTVNNFRSDVTVPSEIVHQAVEAAIYAPNHKLTEPWRFIHLGPETIDAIATLNSSVIAAKDPVKGAKKKARWAAIPGWTVITSCRSDKDDIVLDREDYAATSCAIQNFQLSLYAASVGTKWTSGPITRTPEFAELCGIDLETEHVVGCLWYGYVDGDDGFDGITTPTRRKSVEAVTSWRP